MFKYVAIPFLLALALVTSAQDAENPTIAILRLAFNLSEVPMEESVLNVLQAYGFISSEERATFMDQGEVDGERLNILRIKSPLDIPSVNQNIEIALDREADILVPLSTIVTQAAVNAVDDMDNPPSIIFAGVHNPFRAGIAGAPCIKPAHITGTQSVTPYEDILPLLLVQDPDLQIIGTLFSSGSTSGAYGAQRIREIGTELGLTVEDAAVTAIADMRSAVQGLVNKGVEALILPIDSMVGAGLPIITAVTNDIGMPVFFSGFGYVAFGATIDAGFDRNVEQGIVAGKLLAGFLNGEIDIARTGINIISGLGVSVNLDVAEQLDIEVAEELIDMSSLIIRDGEPQISVDIFIERMRDLGMDVEQIQRQALANPGSVSMEEGAVNFPREMIIRATVQALGSEESLARDRAFLASLQCSDEMIAEQQAALDAAE